MKSKAVFLKSFAGAGAVALSLAIAVPPAAWARADMSSIDTNHDGMISRDEARAAAEKKFDSLDTTHTGKLTMEQIPPMEKAIREMAVHDKDQAIDKGEYMAGVDAAFKEADPTGSGMLNKKALKTKAGRHFLALVE